MKKEMLNFFGVLFILAGSIFLFDSFEGITGFAVFNGINSEVSFPISIVLILVGAIAIFFSEGVMDRTYELSKRERREIQMTFRDWEGQPNSKQKKVMREYGLIFLPGARHSHGEIRYGSRAKTVPSSPSDWRGGRNLAKDLIYMIEEARRDSDKCKSA